MESRTLADALRFIEECLHQRLSAQFDGRGEIRGEARTVLKVAAAVSDADIHANPDAVLDAQAWERLQGIVQRRCAGEPLAYIEGSRGFHAIELNVDRNVLVPRPETELIVDAVLEMAPAAVFSAADLGTGSGAIALALACARPDALITGVDVSAAALSVARANGRSLGLAVEWVESDWSVQLGDRRFDFLCCNPPYIRSSDEHLTDLRYEPALALDGGSDGLDSIRRVVSSSVAHLNAGGRLLLEHGYDQAADVAGIGVAAGLVPIVTLRDLGGHERVSVFGLAE